MPDDSLGDKLGRQVKNIKGGLRDVAHAFTDADPERRTDAMAGRVTGERSRTSRARERMSKDELYAEAKRLGIKGRSKMTKEELLRAVRRA
ncbi:Rho termination factor-like protein [Kribbella sp. VKM Ac-2571]|uniref:Rho termination factor N-terminal domain-containing protein n=1 Tax=Kribbella sp. VKM Ac-2571 TaxID=2512222 RepID=UPI0010DCD86E|nr:Rho termination factor N-terminal domain-containing protein [Kribbella sp. VKM Ac-2571]TDO66543.1 Rho termination factor-like protein [Kribbella sp. VKM Ac-2571]